MFGYVIPDKPNMLMKDFTEFRAYYCGLCKAIGRDNPAFLRLLTNYDCTFLAVLLHNLAGSSPEIRMQGCVLNPVKKKPVAAKSDLMKKAAALTVLLAYYKAGDDVADGGGLKASCVRNSVALSAKKAARLMPEADAVIANRYKELAELEKSGCKSVDMAAEPFARMTEELVCLFAKEITPQLKEFAYGLGKWIYLADALDDVDKDLKTKNYNPFIAAYGDVKDKASFLAQRKDELALTMYSVYNATVRAYDALSVTVSEGVLSNIVYLGMKEQTRRILEGEQKCNTIRI